MTQPGLLQVLAIVYLGGSSSGGFYPNVRPPSWPTLAVAPPPLACLAHRQAAQIDRVPTPADTLAAVQGVNGFFKTSTATS